MAETPPIAQAPIQAPLTDVPVPNVQTPAPTEITQPVTPVLPHPVTPAHQTVQVAQTPQPIPVTIVDAAKLVMDPQSSMSLVDKAYGRE